MIQSDKLPVVFLPGGIQPVMLQYGPLLKALGADIQPLLKDLELYRNGTPPKHYSLTTEVEGLKRAADDAGMASFHLVAYSGGGAVALAFTGTYPERVLSLALCEPAVIPSQEWLQAESAYWQEMAHVMSLPDPQLMSEFMRLELRDGVPLPPPPAGEPPAWMATRPAGLKALVQAFGDYNLPYSRLREFKKPVYIAVTGLSNLVEIRKADALKKIFTDIKVEVYPNRHHFDPPQRAEPERFASALLRLWEKSNS
jgi:pimeloyl-ACP methyl ester carboxylesterase